MIVKPLTSLRQRQVCTPDTVPPSRPYKQGSAHRMVIEIYTGMIRIKYQPQNILIHQGPYQLGTCPLVARFVPNVYIASNKIIVGLRLLRMNR